MPDSSSESVSVPDEVTSELVRLLTSGHFEQFMGLYRETALGIQDDGAVVLAEVVNAGIKNAVPDCEVKLQVLTSVDRVLGLLHLIAGHSWTAPIAACGVPASAALGQRSDVLFGPPRGDQRTRLMVTLPSEAAHDSTLIDALVQGGMNVARINCAHDDAEAWMAMVRRVRASAAAQGVTVKVLMDLAGPKLRTGPIDGGPAVLNLKPRRDAFCVVTAPVLLGLRPA